MRSRVTSAARAVCWALRRLRALVRQSLAEQNRAPAACSTGALGCRADMGCRGAVAGGAGSGEHRGCGDRHKPELRRLPHHRHALPGARPEAPTRSQGVWGPAEERPEVPVSLHVMIGAHDAGSVMQALNAISARFDGADACAELLPSPSASDAIVWRFGTGCEAPARVCAPPRCVGPAPHGRAAGAAALPRPAGRPCVALPART
jgi:hypothetical protein